MKTIIKTIEERASEIFDHPDGHPLSIAKGAYIQGATDQKQIDIEKACVLIKSIFVNGPFVTTSEQRENITRVFRNAMES